jgi:hypothetical protein
MIVVSELKSPTTIIAGLFFAHNRLRLNLPYPRVGQFPDRLTLAAL